MVMLGQKSIFGGYKMIRQAFQWKGLGTSQWYMLLLRGITRKNLFL